MPPTGSCALLWSLVFDDLLEGRCHTSIPRWRGEYDTYAQEYVDDIYILGMGRFPGTVCDLGQGALRSLEEWCELKNLSVNARKSDMVVSTQKR